MVNRYLALCWNLVQKTSGFSSLRTSNLFSRGILHQSHCVSTQSAFWQVWQVTIAWESSFILKWKKWTAINMYPFSWSSYKQSSCPKSQHLDDQRFGHRFLEYYVPQTLDDTVVPRAKCLTVSGFPFCETHGEWLIALQELAWRAFHSQKNAPLKKSWRAMVKNIRSPRP